MMAYGLDVMVEHVTDTLSDRSNLLYVNRVLIICSITGCYHVTVAAVVSRETWLS